MSVSMKLIMNGILMLLIILTGIWVHGLGRPINSGALTVHKLIALAFTVYCTYILINYVKTIHAGAAILILLVIGGLSIIGLFATGAILSFDKPVNRILLAIHTYTPIITIGSVTAAVFLLFKKKV